ncbi:MAG: hypothetical protein HZY76_22325 [Anaerolineae bacterium]|nr:MAG: hypothetical protein HZY76_22325 [Anaerolineae bacterium]
MSSTQAYGVWVAQGQRQRIGRVQQGNLISGNAQVGVRLYGPATTDNVVQANLIGPASRRDDFVGGTQNVGVEIADGASHNVVGGDTPSAATSPGNTLRYNQQHGIVVADDQSRDNWLGAISCSTYRPCDRPGQRWRNAERPG